MRVPPLLIVALVALLTPSSSNMVAPLLTVAPVSVPRTVSVPPAEITVPLAKPPTLTCWLPPLVTVVASAVPPDRTVRTFPLLTTTPELTMPELTNWVVIALSLYVWSGWGNKSGQE
jgi:hypothetical protein